MKGRYPLDALQELRRQAVDKSLGDVAESARRTEQARRFEARARSEREWAEGRFAAESAGERGRLEQGMARAADLQAESVWRAAEARRLAALAAEEQRLRDATRCQAHEEVQARARLAGAEAEAKAVDKHRDRWNAERERAREIDEEENAHEAMLARFARKGGRER